MTSIKLFRISLTYVKEKISTFADVMKIRSIILKILMPLVLGGAILYWMYRGEDW